MSTLRVPVKYDPTIHSQQKKFFLPGLILPPRGANPSQIESADMHFFRPKSPNKDLGPYKCDFRDFKVRTLNGCRFWGLFSKLPQIWCGGVSQDVLLAKKKFWKFKKNLLNKNFKNVFFTFCSKIHSAQSLITLFYAPTDRARPREHYVKNLRRYFLKWPRYRNLIVFKLDSNVGSNVLSNFSSNKAILGWYFIQN